MAAQFDSDSQISIPVGITVGLLASFVQSLGLTVQRKSHVLNQQLPEDQQKVEHRRPLWLLGFSIFISSNLFGSIFQIASLPVVILAPLGAVSLLWNAFFARILLGDVFSIWMLLGTLLIAGGAVLIAIYGIVPEPTHSLEDLLMLFNRPVFIVYFSLLGMITVVSLAVTHISEYSYRRRMALPDVSPPLSPLVLPTSQPSILTTSTTATNAVDRNERTPLIDRKPRPRSYIRSKSPSPSGSQSIISTAISFTTKSTRTPLYLAGSYASFSGIISGMCLLFAKSGVELLMLTFGGDNQFWRWQAWLLLLSLGVCALLQLWYMHKSLVLADPTVVCPLAFCFYNLSSIFNGLVYFDQFSVLSNKQLILVLVGIVILLAGVGIVSFPPAGGYSIDIGAWTAAEDEDEDESVPLLHSDREGEGESEADSEDEHAQQDDEPLPMHPPQPGRSRTPRSHSEDIRLGTVQPDPAQMLPDLEQHRRWITEPPAPVAPPAPVTPRARRLRRESQVEEGAGSGLMHRSRSSYGTAESVGAGSPLGGGSTSRRRRTTLAAPMNPPSGSTVPGPAALSGFSIGLSPVSPGFALVPRERRRRPTVDLEGMRRVVSEGGEARASRDAQRLRGGLEGAREEGLGGEQRGGEEEREAGEGKPARRWRWLRNVFSMAGSSAG
ncbi:uncharacterized protein B0H18DRAFT_1091789 [Fomitopsis serialis]|uniref:uncharacterized protein n=1 Tax=Fomitopsis serialis TaxID=139415 RepID=UPI002008DF11|nr:uncharacterized protein B0H18DRAFT_1091789 [Neoantrodia serialis]KAH9937702.1 hypothetical protein B0H18DRAFT_1091789 [Neoantrodia serialis]